MGRKKIAIRKIEDKQQRNVSHVSMHVDHFPQTQNRASKKSLPAKPALRAAGLPSFQRSTYSPHLIL